MVYEADALRIYHQGAEVPLLTAVGTLRGVIVTHAAAANGPGAGRLRCNSAGLAWQPPGESQYGDAVDVSAGGVFLVTGPSADKFLRVTVHADYLMLPSETRVLLADRYNNAIASDDVTAAEAAAGDVETHELTAANDGDETLYNVRAWLDPTAEATAYLEISANGSDWSSPTSDPTGIELGDLPAGATVPVYLRRTIPAGEPYDPKVLTHLHFGFDNRN